MNEKQRKTLVRLEYLELLLSIIGFITCCLVFALTRISERYFFYMIAAILGMNIIYSIRKIEKTKEQVKVIKYSNKLLSTKSYKKVSY